MILTWVINILFEKLTPQCFALGDGEFVEVGGNFTCCLGVLIFMGLGKAYRLGGDFKVIVIWKGGGGRGEGGLDLFYGGSWPLESPCKDFSLATGGGLGWMKWLNHRAGKGFIFHAIIPALFGKKFILNMPYTIT